MNSKTRDAQQPIYLDHNASTPVDPRVFEAMRPFLTHVHGNPSSPHAGGRLMADALASARARVADLLGASPEEIIFTSGGTESNNLAIKGIARAYGSNGGHIITSAVEHPAVINPCRYLAERGFELTVVPVDGRCRIDPDAVRAAMRPDTVLVTIMHANNEVGTIQPISELAEIARLGGARFHTDAAQSCGKIPTRVDDLGVDLLSIAGHKMYAPHGIGALYIRRGVTLEPLHHGAGHERGLRPGTEPVANIVGLGTAARVAAESDGSEGVRRLRDRLWQALQAELTDAVRLNGDPVERLPNTLNVGFRGVDNHRLLADLPQVLASPGAACHAREETRSAVLAAMDVPAEYAHGSIRLSLGRPTTEQQVDEAVKLIVAAVKHARRDGVTE